MNHFAPEQDLNWKENKDLEPFPFSPFSGHLQLKSEKVLKNEKEVKKEAFLETPNDVEMEENTVNIKSEPNISDELEVFFRNSLFWFKRF